MIKAATMDFNSTTAEAPHSYWDVADQGYLAEHLGVRATFIVAITLLITTTILGNTLTLIAIVRTRALRTTANLLVVSLAVADLMVGIGVMPPSLVKTISPDRTFPPFLCNLWVSLDVLCCTASILNLCIISLDRYRSIKCPFRYILQAYFPPPPRYRPDRTVSSFLCNLWVSLDVLCCTASILNLCIISLDRYRSIKSPFSYKKRQTTGHMLLQISGVWILSTIISVAPLLGWKTKEEKIEPTCNVSQDKLYTIFSTFGAFFIPMTIMLALYWLIFLEARRRIRGCSFTKYRGHTVQSLEKGDPRGDVSRDGLSHSTASTTPSSTRKPETQPQSLLLPPNLALTESASNSDIRGGQTGLKSKHGGSTTSLPVTPKQFCGATALQRMQAEKQAIASTREHKAAKTLAIVTGAFLVCWLPFFSFALFTPFFPDWTIPWWFQNLILWLGYFNSMLNPIIYTKFNPEFQKAFRKTLKCPNTAT